MLKSDLTRSQVLSKVLQQLPCIFARSRHKLMLPIFGIAAARVLYQNVAASNGLVPPRLLCRSGGISGAFLSYSRFFLGLRLLC
jgi:hypothetical protein